MSDEFIEAYIHVLLTIAKQFGEIDFFSSAWLGFMMYEVNPRLSCKIYE